MRTRVRGWRWRKNPLRRRSDVVEAWTALGVAVLLGLGAPAAGVATGWWAHDEARTAAVQQRADRHPVRAEVVGRTPDGLSAFEGGTRRTYRVTVRWTEGGGQPRTAEARVPAGTRDGDRVEVWFDGHGRNVPPPAGDSAVWQHTLTMGTCAAGGTVAVVLLGHTVVRRVAMRRRMADWDRDWALTEPQWTRRSRGEI
ncbi:Rv1733c family protein [Streptomyces griseosporeus]|uniref:Rv1733c family protein n=1 Tax=Streptomyces griseosporeus TaxID=1910 RepID=UPI0037A579CD